MKRADRLQCVCVAQTFHGNGALMHLKLNVSAQWFHFQAFLFFIYIFHSLFFPSPASKRFYLLLFPHFYRFHFYLFFYFRRHRYLSDTNESVRGISCIFFFLYLFSHCSRVYSTREFTIYFVVLSAPLSKSQTAKRPRNHLHTIKAFQKNGNAQSMEYELCFFFYWFIFTYFGQLSLRGRWMNELFLCRLSPQKKKTAQWNEIHALGMEGDSMPQNKIISHYIPSDRWLNFSAEN